MHSNPSLLAQSCFRNFSASNTHPTQGHSSVLKAACLQWQLMQSHHYHMAHMEGHPRLRRSRELAEAFVTIHAALLLPLSILLPLFLTQMLILRAPPNPSSQSLFSRDLVLRHLVLGTFQENRYQNVILELYHLPAGWQWKIHCW